MPIGSAVHARTFPLCESLNFREWSGFYAVSAYEAHHEHEYNAIRNASALIDVSPDRSRSGRTCMRPLRDLLGSVVLAGQVLV